MTQDAVLKTFDGILGTLTRALGGIAAVSLLVAGVLIMNVMLVAVSQRTQEIGLLKALGARRSQILGLFLAEAIYLALLGALVGVLAGLRHRCWRSASSTRNSRCSRRPGPWPAPSSWPWAAACCSASCPRVAPPPRPRGRACPSMMGPPMNASELIRFTSTSAVSHRLRSGLTALGIAIGVAAVVLLTSMGEGLRVYMVAQFTQFGTNIVGMNPGKAQTFGMPTGVLNSARPLSLADAQALTRLPYVRSIVPLVQGTASVEGGGRERQTIVSGTGDELTEALSFRVALGEFLPPDDPERAPGLRRARQQAAQRAVRRGQSPRRAHPRRRPALHGDRGDGVQGHDVRLRPG